MTCYNIIFYWLLWMVCFKVEQYIFSWQIKANVCFEGIFNYRILKMCSNFDCANAMSFLEVTNVIFITASLG